MKIVVIAILVVELGGLFASGKSVGSLNCLCPRLPIKGCLRPYIPPGECCPRCSGCKPTGEISYDDDGNLLLWKPSPCEFCTCVNGRPQCVIQDCAAPFCENYVTVKGRCCPVCPPRGCNPTGDIFYDSNGILSWRPDPCTYCSCVNGRPSCNIRDCAAPSCPNYVIPEGECCPVCPSDLLYYLTKKPTEGTVTLPTLGPAEEYTP